MMKKVISWVFVATLMLLNGFTAIVSAAPLKDMPVIMNPELAASAPSEYAWDIFIALNWPALEKSRGVADQSKPFGGQQTAVWETWKDTVDVFLPMGKQPVGWNASAPPVPDPLKTNLRLTDGIILQSSANPSFVTGGLLDINDAPIYSEIRMNQIAFDYILGNELYNVEGQLNYLANKSNLKMPLGSMEVKASWRILDPVADKDIASRYFQAQGVLQTDSGDKVPVTLGLTAMNIMVKITDNWFWTAFEQVDNPEQTYDSQFPEVKLDVRIDAATQKVNAAWQKALKDTPWEFYRSNGAQINFVDSDNKPTYLTNTQQETDIQKTSSCIACHAYSAIGRVDSLPTRLFPLRTLNADGTATGYLGTPVAAELRDYVTLDFMWSFIEASAKNPSDNTRFLMVNGKPPQR